MNQQLVEAWGLQLGRLLVALREDVPEAGVAAAKNRLLHAFGVSLANSRLEAAEVAWRTLGESSGKGFVFGRDRLVDPGDAAFVNAVIGHGSLLEDCGPGGLREGSHPGTFIIPAALASAQMRGADGRALIAGLVVGYEAVSRIGAAAPAQVVQRRFRPVGVMAAFGAAAAASAVLGANAAQTAAALSIAANLAGGSTQGIFEGTMEPYFQSGFGARSGLLAARLAMAGAATTRQAFEGEFGFFVTYGGEAGKLEELVGDRSSLGIEVVGSKRFAACLQNQETLALIVDARHRLPSARDIQRIAIRRPQIGTNGLNSPGVSRTEPFENMLSAQMSARFTAAAAFLGHPVGDPGFYAGHFADSEIVALTRRIDLEPADGPISVTVEATDGSRIVLDEDKSRVLFPDGETLRARFRARAEAVLGRRADEAAALIDSLDTVADLGQMTRALAPAS